MPDESTGETPGFVAFTGPFRGGVLPLTQPLVLTFPGGSKIELGERATLEGCYPFISLTSLSDLSGLPSLTLWIDPVSFQPMITLRTGPGLYQSYPLDKKLQSPYDKSWSPSVGSVSGGVSQK